MFGIRRMAEISLNGYEWILDSDNEVMKWENRDDALLFLGENGVDVDSLDENGIEIVNI